MKRSEKLIERKKKNKKRKKQLKHNNKRKRKKLRKRRDKRQSKKHSRNEMQNRQEVVSSTHLWLNRKRLIEKVKKASRKTEITLEDELRNEINQNFCMIALIALKVNILSGSFVLLLSNRAQLAVLSLVV